MLPTNNTRPQGFWNQLFLQQLVDFLLQLAELLFYVVVVVFGHRIWDLIPSLYRKEPEYRVYTIEGRREKVCGGRSCYIFIL